MNNRNIKTPNIWGKGIVNPLPLTLFEDGYYVRIDLQLCILLVSEGGPIDWGLSCTGVDLRKGSVTQDSVKWGFNYMGIELHECSVEWSSGGPCDPDVITVWFVWNLIFDLFILNLLKICDLKKNAYVAGQL